MNEAEAPAKAGSRREELLERLNNLVRDKQAVEDKKKAEMEAYNNELKDLKDEINDVLQLLNEGG